jgi:hypothetical protein
MSANVAVIGDIIQSCGAREDEMLLGWCLQMLLPGHVC